MSSSNSVSEIDSCDLHIRTLSTILHNMHRRADTPTRTRKDVPAFLRHIATLLTRGTSRDKEANKNIVAVTATVEESSMKLLIVAQNTPNASQNGSEPFNMGVTAVERSSRTAVEIFNRLAA